MDDRHFNSQIKKNWKFALCNSVQKTQSERHLILQTKFGCLKCESEVIRRYMTPYEKCVLKTLILWGLKTDIFEYMTEICRIGIFWLRTTTLKLTNNISPVSALTSQSNNTTAIYQLHHKHFSVESQL